MGQRAAIVFGSLALMIVVVGVALIVVLRATHTVNLAPPRVPLDQERVASLQPALAGALIAGGRVRRAHVLGTVIDLMARGVLLLDTEHLHSRGVLIQCQAGWGASLQPHERSIVALWARDGAITVSKLSGLLHARRRVFGQLVVEELDRRGFIDLAGLSLKRRLGTVSAALLLAFGLSLLLVLMVGIGPWSLLIPLALAALSMTAALAASSVQTLTPEGRQWRTYWIARRADDLRAASGEIGPQWGHVIALGFGHRVAAHRRTNKHSSAVLFKSLITEEEIGAVASLIASAGAAADGGGAA
jgi:hypothetical protein